MSLAQKLRQELETLKGEFQVCRRKLDSKCEALLILSQDLDQCRQERDQFKLMAEQVQERYQALKRQLAGIGPRSTTLEDMNFTEMKSQNLASLLCEMREVNKSLQFEVDDLKQKLHDAQGDIKLLREQIARQRVGTTDEGMNTRHFPAHEREDLVQRLEASREEFCQLERDLQQVLDEKEEYVRERDTYKTKYERLNTELNYILKGDEKRVIDIDALVMENKYLQERLKQTEEEKSMAMATVSKYKTLLERRKAKGILKLGQTRSGGVVVTQKQVQQLLEARSSSLPTHQTMADLQALASTLLDTVNDKNLALSHQRKTNKILGNRVAELEKKLKTLEVSGLWSLPAGAKSPTQTIDKLKLECEEIKKLMPRQMSVSSDTSILSAKDEQEELHSDPPTPGYQSPDNAKSDSFTLEDLDLLPTKEAPNAAEKGPMDQLAEESISQSHNDLMVKASGGQEKGAGDAGAEQIIISTLIDHPNVQPQGGTERRSGAVISTLADHEDVQQQGATDSGSQDHSDSSEPDTVVADRDDEEEQDEEEEDVDDKADADVADAVDAAELEMLVTKAAAKVVNLQEENTEATDSKLSSASSPLLPN